MDFSKLLIITAVICILISYFMIDDTDRYRGLAAAVACEDCAKLSQSYGRTSK